MVEAILLDYDWTLAPFNQEAGIRRVKEMLAPDFGSKVEEVGDEFGEIHNLMMDLLYSRADSRSTEMMRNINSYAVLTGPEVGNYDISFMWSREVWLKYLSDKYELGLEGDFIMSVTNAYWDAIADSSPLFPDAADYLARQKDIGIYVITASDRRVSISEDTIRYITADSEKQKIDRMERAGLGKFIPQANIITGDPFDKPSGQFWDKVIAKAKIKSAKDAIVVDDSLSAVKSAREAGFTGYVIDRLGVYDRIQIATSVDRYITGFGQLAIEKQV